MFKVKQLYVVFDDGDGYKYLIPKEDYSKFDKAYTRIEDSYEEHKDEDMFYEELNDLLEAFSDGVLEGELHYVVLDEHVIEGGSR
jgi:hypothetical protein